MSVIRDVASVFDSIADSLFDVTRKLEDQANTFARIRVVGATLQSITLSIRDFFSTIKDSFYDIAVKLVQFDDDFNSLPLELSTVHFSTSSSYSI